MEVTDKWRVRLGGRYDASDWELRAWSAELRRRAHCLTWKVGYSDIGDDFMIGAEINGLFGNDEPPKDTCPEDGPPDYWEHRDVEVAEPAAALPDAAADETLEAQPDEDTASEAMETP